MATLISSKQISGVVTASVINGEFLVSGSSTLTGSMFIQGDVSASSISASTFQGSGTNLTFGGSGFITSSAQVSLPSVAGYTFFSANTDFGMNIQQHCKRFREFVIQYFRSERCITS